MRQMQFVCDLCKKEIVGVRKEEAVSLVDYYAPETGSIVNSIKAETMLKAERSALDLHEHCFFLLKVALSL